MQAQYIFIHDALDELITCGETDISAAGLRVKVNRLRKVVPGKGITGFAEQFQVDKTWPCSPATVSCLSYTFIHIKSLL